MQWDRFRAGQQFAARHIAQLEKTAQTVLASLYDELMRPVESLMRAQTVDHAHAYAHQVGHPAIWAVASSSFSCVI